MLVDDVGNLKQQVLVAHKEAEQNSCDSFPEVDALLCVERDHSPDAGWDRRCLVYGETDGEDVTLGKALECYATK